MKQTTFIYLFLFFTVSAFGQKITITDVKNKYWGASDQYKDLLEIPEKWKNESAVIMYQEYNYIYEGSSKSVDYIETYRKRVKLLDKSAIELYSEFSFAEKFKVEKGFSKKGGRIFAGFKVIKSDGTEKEVDIEDAVEVKSGQNNIKKIAIPDLQEGDIIDYFYHIYEPFISYQEYVFSPVISTLNSSYPIMNQKLTFEVEKDFFVNFNSYNGAPPLKKIASNNKKKTIYALEDNKREKNEGLRWFNSDRVFPLIKFQVVYARKNKMEKAANAFIGEKGEVLSKVDEQQVLDFFDKNLGIYSSSISGFNEHLRKKGIKLSEKEKIVKEAYIYLRNSFLISKIEPLVFHEEGYIKVLPYGLGGFLTESGFITVMGNILVKKEIDFNVIIGVSKRLGTIDELLLVAETDLMIRVNTPTPIYLSNFSLHTDPDKIPYNLEGTEAYQIDLSFKGAQNIKRTKIPISSHDDNKSEQEINLKLNEDMKNMTVNRVSHHYGHNKDGHQTDLIFIHDYVKDDNKYFDNKGFFHEAIIRKKDKEQVLNLMKEKDEKDKKRQKEIFQKETEQEFKTEFKSYDSFEFINLGRSTNDSINSFSYKETFTLDGIIKKAGKNHILNIGMFIGGQVALEEDEMKREYDVYMRYPRSFHNTISLEIPAGYTIEGLENLQKNIINNAGSFVSSAEVDGNKLIVKTAKIYHHNFEKKEDWQKMVAFLEAGYQFTQEKILLKKQ
ncbi:MAG: hypothetical protein ACI94Y_002460 [Maribacter sp.]|jgi:hypothetical protein